MWNELMRPVAISGLLLCFACTATAGEQDRTLMLEFFTGVPYNIPLPLVIRQSGQPNIDVIAHYFSEPFVVPISWVWRVGYWSGNSGWEFEAIHHKVFLDDPPQEIQEFSVSHGLNFLLINRVWNLDSYALRVGGGVPLTHPETTVRGKTHPEDEGIFHMGYYVSGPAVAFSAGRLFALLGDLSLDVEAKAFSSFISVPIAEGNAHFSHLSLQFSFGLGYRIPLD
jgi:hypothetical protein